jgi:hypothetical protein
VPAGAPPAGSAEDATTDTAHDDQPTTSATDARARPEQTTVERVAPDDQAEDSRAQRVPASRPDRGVREARPSVEADGAGTGVSAKPRTADRAEPDPTSSNPTPRGPSAPSVDASVPLDIAPVAAPTSASTGPAVPDAIAVPDGRIAALAAASTPRTLLFGPVEDARGGRSAVVPPLASVEPHASVQPLVPAKPLSPLPPSPPRGAPLPLPAAPSVPGGLCGGPGVVAGHNSGHDPHTAVLVDVRVLSLSRTSVREDYGGAAWPVGGADRPGARPG